MIYKTAFIFILGTILFTNCIKKEEFENEEILATVDGDVITVKEFELNYEFGFANQKTVENAKEAYLHKMIAELLLAKEGFNQKIDTSSSIQNGVKTITHERIIEEVFNTEVIDKIEVTEEEIESEINKAAVSFQLKYIPLQSEAQGQRLKEEVEVKGYDQVITELTNEMTSAEISAVDFQTPYLKAEEIDPMLLAEVSQLTINEVSEPIFFNQQWFLFVVANIKRQPVSPEDYIHKAETYRKIIYNRKAMQGAEVFISDLMTPLDVRTKRNAFVKLSKAMKNWFLAEQPVNDLVQQVESEKESYHQEIKQILDEKLVEFGNTTWSVEDFLTHFIPGLYQLRPNDKKDFDTQFADVIALVVRNYHLLEIASKEELEESQEVKRDIKLWENKWVFQALRAKYLSEVPFDNKKVEEFYEVNKANYPFVKQTNVAYSQLSEEVKKRIRKEYLNAHLEEYVESLKSKYPVHINKDKLAEINLKKDLTNPVQQVQLFKQNSNRMAFPVVDPNW